MLWDVIKDKSSNPVQKFVPTQLAEENQNIKHLTLIDAGFETLRLGTDIT